MKNKDLQKNKTLCNEKILNSSISQNWGTEIKISIIAIAIIALVIFSLCNIRTALANTGETSSSSNAETQVYLKSDESQLKFTAPSTINFMLDGSGNFTCPTEVQFKNDSVMDIEIDGYTITSESGSTGVEDADSSEYASQNDVYSVKVSPSHSTARTVGDYVFSKSWSQSSSTNTDWEISTSEKLINLVFSNGRMPNPTRQWADTGQKLQTVTWSVKMAN